MSKAGGEGQVRSQLEAVVKERDGLQRSLEALERENEELKKSVYELSYVLSTQTSTGAAAKVFSLDGADRAPPPPSRPGHPPSPFKAPVEDGFGGLMGGADSAAAAPDRRLNPAGKLVGHTAAVYAVAFSPCGNLVASGGFDRTVRLWEGGYPHSQVACLAEHRQLVSDLAWAPDARSLVSCSFDATVALWDTETGQRVNNVLRLEGMLQCVSYADGGDGEGGGGGGSGSGALAYAGSTARRLYGIDLRDPLQVVQSWPTRAHVNAMHVFGDGSRIITGDAAGVLTTWDVRAGGRPLETTRLETPVAHIAAAPPDAGRLDEEGHLLAANCYDNTLRVFYRERGGGSGGGGGGGAGFDPGGGGGSASLSPMAGSAAAAAAGNNGNNGGGGGASGAGRSSTSSRATSRGAGSAASTTTSTSMSPSRTRGGGGGGAAGSGGSGGGGSAAPVASLTPLLALRGHTVKNWPIRTAFFKGLQHRTPRTRRAAAGNSAGGSAHGRRAAAESVGGGIGYEDSGKDWAHSLVLATGSADGNIYTFDMSKGEGGDLQTLRGHNDRVYAVHFHPTEPRLVSGSADQTVRIWGPSKGGRRNGRK